jgi:gamma-glutamyltranspeptidase / glutathione hydrolase
MVRDTRDQSISSRLLAEGSIAHGTRVVTSASGNAAAAGVQMFAMGGNAFDAALAAAFVECVALPMKCGLAGDVVALYRTRGEDVTTLLSIGPGCAALADGAELAVTGPASVGVPGAPDGYATLARHARLPLMDLIRPALEAARNGIVWTRPMLAYLRQSSFLLDRFSPDCPYLAQGFPVEGQRLRLPRIADLLQTFSERGSELFDGELGGQIARHVQQLGGFIRAEDFRARPARELPAKCITLSDGERLWVTPAPTQGVALIDAIAAWGLENVPLVEAVRVARQRSIPRDEGTSVVTAADSESTVVIVHSNSFPRFGSGVVMPSGLVLNNRPGRGFNLDAKPGTPGAPAAGATPPTTLHAWALERGDMRFYGATPGGINQLPWNAQTVSMLLQEDQRTVLEDLIVMPRWAFDSDGQLICEGDAAAAVRDIASSEVPPLSLGCVQQVISHDRRDTLPLHTAAADPRMLAVALGLL